MNPIYHVGKLSTALTVFANKIEAIRYTRRIHRWELRYAINGFVSPLQYVLMVLNIINSNH